MNRTVACLKLLAVASLAGLLLGTPSTSRAAGEIPAREFAVRAGKILTMTGKDFEPGVVIIRKGRFVAVGDANTPIPAGLPIVDASSRVLMPGFLELNSQRGLDRTYEVAANASFVRISDAMNPASLEIEDARRNGLTTLLVAPSDRAFMAGRGAILHPQGLATDTMIVKQDAALKISLEPGSGESRMGRLAKLRDVLDETKLWMADAPKRRKAQETDDSSHDALVALLEGKLPALVHCATAADVSAAFALAAEYGFHLVPVIGPGAWRAASLLAANRVDCVLTPQMEAWERQPDGSVLRIELPRILHEAGVSFALSTDPYDAGAQHPWYQAALAVRSGLPRDVALAAITKVPARMMGFGAKKGVIADGADADFLLLSADPFSGMTFVEESYIRGTRIYAKESDEKLARLLRRTSEPPLTASEPDHDEHEGEEEPVADERPTISRDHGERANRWPFAWGPR